MFFDYDPFTSWGDRFVIISVDTIIAHHWVGKGDDLSIETLISDRFLIPRHTCCEYNFTIDVDVSAKALAFKIRPIF